MLEFFKAGGFAMIPVLLFSALTLGVAALFAQKPLERRVAMVRALSAATVFAILSGIAANLASVMSKVPSNPEWAHSPDLVLIVMTGIGESLAPAIMGLTLLALAWLVTAVGVRRMSEA